MDRVARSGGGIYRRVRFSAGLMVLLGLSPVIASAQATVDRWVGCWSLDHAEDWAPRVPQEGFPSGSATPAPRLLMLDRLPGSRTSLGGAEGARTYRAEWVGSALRGSESWAVRSDGWVFVEHTAGVRVNSALLEGPPVEGGIPARWFFRRTDTPYPEVRSLVRARRIPCPEGKAPHTQVESAGAAALLAAAGVQATWVYYDGSARRITRAHPDADRGLSVSNGTARTTAWNQVARLVDEAARTGEDTPHTVQGADPAAGTGWIAGRRAGADGRTHGFALHVHRAPAEWLAEGTSMESLIERLLEELEG